MVVQKINTFVEIMHQENLLQFLLDSIARELQQNDGSLSGQTVLGGSRKSIREKYLAKKSQIQKTVNERNVSEQKKILKKFIHRPEKRELGRSKLAKIEKA